MFVLDFRTVLAAPISGLSARLSGGVGQEEHGAEQRREGFAVDRGVERARGEGFAVDRGVERARVWRREGRVRGAVEDVRL